MFQNVTIRHKAQGTENDDDGNFLLDVRQDGNDALPNCAFFGALQYTKDNVKDTEYYSQHARQQIAGTCHITMQVAPFLMDNHASLKLHEKKEEEKKGGGGGGGGKNTLTWKY